MRADPTWPSDALRLCQTSDAGEPLAVASIVRAGWVWLRAPAGTEEAPERVEDWSRLAEPTLGLLGGRLGWTLWLDVRSPWVARGRVVDDGTGEPVPGARVVASREGDARFFSVEGPADHGAFALTLPAWLAGTRVAVIARAPGRTPAAARLYQHIEDDGTVGGRRPAGEDQWEVVPDVPSVVLRLPVGPGLTLQGFVTDLDDRPLAGAEVFVRVNLPGDPTDEDPTISDVVALTSDARGEFRLDHVPPGSGAERLGPACASVEVGARARGFRYEERWHLVDAQARPLHVHLSRTVRVDGIVFDADGRPIEASVWTPGDCTGDTVCAGADGRFSIEAASEELELEVTAGDCLPRRVLARGPGELVIRLVRAATIRGRVVGAARHVRADLPVSPRTDRTERRLAPGELVDLPRDDRPIVAAVQADGTFELWPVPPDAREVLVSADEGGPVRAPPGAAGVVLVAGPRPEPVRCRQRVTLRVVAEESGLPLRAACDGQEVPPEGATLTFEREGPLEVLRLEAPGRLPARHRLPEGAIAGATSHVDVGVVALARAGAVQARFRSWPARPVCALLARWSDGAGERDATEDPPARATDAWTIGAIAPGRVALTLGVTCHGGGHGCGPDRKHLAPAVALDVRAGETTAVEVDLARLAPPLR